jgi:hypothetical protein
VSDQSKNKKIIRNEYGFPVLVDVNTNCGENDEETLTLDGGCFDGGLWVSREQSL